MQQNNRMPEGAALASKGQKVQPVLVYVKQEMGNVLDSDNQVALALKDMSSCG